MTVHPVFFVLALLLALLAFGQQSMTAFLFAAVLLGVGIVCVMFSITLEITNTEKPTQGE